jgi:aerobic-type carbon monoxide dehydrogenase small subunit (CoxS/CutS family)
MNFILNGRPVSIDPRPGEMLSELLRERLGLTGTKIGCNEAECGSCTVIVDGAPILSCVYPAQKVDGKVILTIEGLAQLRTNPYHNVTHEWSRREEDLILSPLQEHL